MGLWTSLIFMLAGSFSKYKYWAEESSVNAERELFPPRLLSSPRVLDSVNVSALWICLYGEKQHANVQLSFFLMPQLTVTKETTLKLKAKLVR